MLAKSGSFAKLALYCHTKTAGAALQDKTQKLFNAIIPGEYLTPAFRTAWADQIGMIFGLRFSDTRDLIGLTDSVRGRASLPPPSPRDLLNLPGTSSHSESLSSPSWRNENSHVRPSFAGGLAAPGSTRGLSNVSPMMFMASPRQHSAPTQSMTSTGDSSVDELTKDMDNLRQRANDLLQSSKAQRDLLNHRISYLEQMTEQLKWSPTEHWSQIK